MSAIDPLVKRAERFSLAALEQATGLSRRTVWLIRTNQHLNPRLKTWEKFRAGVRDLEKKARSRREGRR